jgi:hypothetical protein
MLDWKVDRFRSNLEDGTKIKTPFEIFHLYFTIIFKVVEELGTI